MLDLRSRLPLVALCAASCAVAIAFGAAQIRASAPTYDEPVHLASGYLTLETSLPPLNWRDHPPFAEVWAALPLLALKPSTLPGSPEWGKLYDFADAFLYKNRVDARRMLDAARLWSLGTWTLALTLPLVLWADALGGAPAAAAAALLAAFCPALFSNAALTTTDAAPAVFYFLAFFALSRRPRRRRHWIAAGVCTGLALASKFSMIALPPLAAIVLASEARLEPQRRPSAGDALLALASAGLALAAGCFGRIGLYWYGLTATLTRLDAGRASFLLGSYSTSGFAAYFPTALAVKTPLPLLIGGAVGALLWLRRPNVDALWAVAPGAAYFLAACFSKTDIGYRHILPVFPFLILCAAWAAAAAWRSGTAGRVVAGLLAAWLVVGVGRCAPDFLSYFNEAAGGPSGGWRVLVDSNLDWGQGLKPLAEDLRRRGNPAVFLSYFGVGDPSYYGIRYYPVAWYSNVSRRDGVTLPGPSEGPWLAVSATNLQAVYFADHSLFRWLDPARAVARPGGSIFLFDLSHDAEGRRHLAALLQASGASAQAQEVALGR